MIILAIVAVFFSVWAFVMAAIALHLQAKHDTHATEYLALHETLITWCAYASPNKPMAKGRVRRKS
jgi:hypothetical protein